MATIVVGQVMVVGGVEVIVLWEELQLVGEEL